MGGMSVSRFESGFTVVHVLGRRTSGDTIILEAGEAALLGSGQVRFHIIEVEVEANVAIKIAVTRVAGIAFVAAPNLLGRVAVAPKSGDCFGGENGSEDGVAGARRGIQKAVRIDDKPPDTRFVKDILQA